MLRRNFEDEESMDLLILDVIKEYELKENFVIRVNPIYKESLDKQILELKSGGTRFALPFSTLCTLKIPKLEKEKQLSFIKTITAFERKIKNEEKILNDLHKQKNYLLNNMFI